MTTPVRTTRERLASILAKHLPDDATFEAAMTAVDQGNRDAVVRTLGKHLPDDETFLPAVELLDQHLAA